MTEGLSPYTYGEDKTKVNKNQNNVLVIREAGSQINENQSLNLSKDYPFEGVPELFIYHIHDELHPAKDQALNQVLDRDQTKDKSITKVYKNERDWIDPEIKMVFSGFNMCDINMITSQNLPLFKDTVIYY